MRALVRPGSDTSFLRQIGVELVSGDLADAAALRQVLTGADIVYNCAARVSDWGPWKVFEQEAVSGTRNLIDVCRAVKIGRLLHVSSISVYGHHRLGPGEDITEETPLGRKFWLWDYYPRAKLLAEEIARELGPDVTVVRPSWIYGPRDRVTIPRVVKALQERRVPIIGKGDNLLNIIYAGDVAAGAILAATNPAARGQAYNLCSTGEITQCDLLNSLTDTLAVAAHRQTRPLLVGPAFRLLQGMLRPAAAPHPTADHHAAGDLPGGPLDALQHRQGPGRAGLAAARRHSGRGQIGRRWVHVPNGRHHGSEMMDEPGERMSLSRSG